MKFLLTLAAILAFGAKAHANPTFEVAYTTFVTVGIDVSSDTAHRINPSIPDGFNANSAGLLVQNQGSYSVWLGGVSVSTSAASNRGIELKPGASVVWSVFKDYKRASALVPVFAKAADAGPGTPISVVWFGY